ncbi:MAG: hypothetical protein RL630_2221 [Verrucomicrobiota bacterium]|jgi:hypothetical protein
MAIFTLSAQATAQTVLTVRDAEYRSRWAGKQEDRIVTPQYFAPGGGLDEESAGASSTEEPTEPSLVESMDQMAENVKRGLRFGPLDFQLGLSNGWEYSSQNSVGGSNDFADNNSFFTAPTIGITYEREIGVWTVNARFGGGYRYYFNQDYTAAGTGVQRNPLALTGGIDIGYNTSRLSVNLSASASSGSGYDITTGSNSWQTAASSALSLRYIITEEFSTGAAASISYSNTADAQAAEGEPAQENSYSLNFGASAFADYLLTPKTNLRFSLSAGQDSQAFSGLSNEGRLYYDAMLTLTYQIAPKFSIDAGGGIGYVIDENIPDGKYAGLRPIYTGAINYTPTEKTYFKASISMLGADIMPNFSLVAGWDAREKTRLSMSVYQNQGFSSLSPDQYNVTRGILGTVSQRLIKGIDLSLSAGYEQSIYEGLDGAENAPAAVEGPADYWLANASIFWRFREWLAWQNTFMLSTGQGESNELQTRFSSSLNLNF